MDCATCVARGGGQPVTLSADDEDEKAGLAPPDGLGPLAASLEAKLMAYL